MGAGGRLRRVSQMTRTPTPLSVSLAWWREALRRLPEAIPDDPKPGFYQRRLVKGGVYVPCRIWLEQDVDEAGELLDEPRLLAEVNGEPAEPDDIWSYVAGNPITEQMFRYLVARREWSERYAPRDFVANPRTPIDHLSTPVLF